MKTRKLRYLLLDVFTGRPLSGNPLAVVLDGDGLLDSEMQAIAREFNLSETVFLTRPQLERNTAGLRIFTPQTELPFAGHPTIGAAIVVAREVDAPVVRLEERIGTITALVETGSDGVAEARFGLPNLPEPAGSAPDRGAIALALGILPEDIGCGPYRPAVWTAGLVFHLVPVRDARVLAALRPSPEGWADTFVHSHHAAYLFTETPAEPGCDFAARMFMPGLPGMEDPGTGSAAAALIGLVAEHAQFDDGQGDYIVRQGDEMGRPCRIRIQVRKAGGVLTHGGIGGQAVAVAEGLLDIG